MRTIGHYQLLEKLGSGGMGDVFLAEDLSLGRKVAIKLLPSRFATDQKRLERFEKEARIISALNHPNILTIYEIGQHEEEQYIVTEYVDGETLSDRMRRSPLRDDEIVSIATDVAAALAAAHAQGVIHRDIKPANIMIRADGIVKVLDFGLAKWNEPPSEEAATLVRQTEPGTVMGTATYMSPEQARGIAVDARSDLFSLGAVVYEMLTGQPPFSGETTTETIASIIHEEVVPVSRFRPDAPPQLQWIVEKALQKDLDDRFQSARELLGDLRRFGRQLESSETQQSLAGVSDDHSHSRTVEHASQSSAEYFVQTLGKHRWKAFAAVIALTAVAALLFSFFSTTGAELESVAVLPFVHSGSDPDTEYLADGLTESLINDLSNIQNLRVVPRSLVFAYKNSDKSVAEIAAELDARAVVTGRLVRSEDELSVQADLIDAHDRAQLWGNRFSGTVSDFLSLQQRVTRDVAARLRPDMASSERERIEQPVTSDAEAYDLYIRGRYLWNRRGTENLERAAELFRQAIDRDPAFARAWSGLAQTYLVLPTHAPVDPMEVFPRARAAAERALELDPALADPYAVLAGIATEFDRDFAAADRAFRKSIELDPDSAVNRYWYAEFLAARGRTDEAIVQARRAREKDPLSITAAQGVAVTYLDHRDLDAAKRALRVAEELEPTFPTLPLARAYIHHHEGDVTRAVEYYERASRSMDNPALRVVALALRGEIDEANRLHEELKRAPDPQPYSLAIAAAGVGNYEEAMDWLERADEQRSPLVFFIHREKVFEPLHDDPRFRDLASRLDVALRSTPAASGEPQ